ncbi:Callose synthase 10 [Nymphaea thermarum]|nr:Callose synthase 10 [Nymphaea thermarum]
MSRVASNWERLVRATLEREQLRTSRQGHIRESDDLLSAVPPSLEKRANIDAILQAANVIEDEDPNVARILCEQAYTLAQNLDPKSEGRGVLQFKTGLMSVIKQKLSKRDGVRIDRNQDIERLWQFYQSYKKRYKVDDIQKQEQRWRESGAFSGQFGEMEQISVGIGKVYATLRALVEVMELLSRDAPREGVVRQIHEELRKIKPTTDELTPYNIVPLDAPSLTNAIGWFPEVKAAVSAIRYSANFPELPSDMEDSQQHRLDLFDLLQYVFGFQKDNVRNQRENVILSIANAQSCFAIPAGVEPRIDDKEADVNRDGKATHSAWRNYDDFNEHFWSARCLDLGWPMRKDSPFFKKSKKWKGASKKGFVEHRTFLHLYRSFHRLWIFLAMMFQERYYVGRGLYESISDYARYVLFWLVIFVCKFSFAYFLQIKPLVSPTKTIVNLSDLKYSWHDLVSKHNHNALTVASLWAPIYLLDLHIWYTLLSALIGGVMGARARLGEESLEMKKIDAAKFSPFWNEIIKSLREEDYISNREMDLLSMPSNLGNLRLVQWPLFLLSSKIFLAIDLAVDCKDTQMDLWNRISKDEYMAYAVQECYYSVEKILLSLADGEGRLWVERLFREINESILERSLLVNLKLKKLPMVVSRFTALTGLLLDTWNILIRAKNENRLFSRIHWPNDPEVKEQVKRLHLLLTVKDSAENVPKNLEARRRLQFFTNSLFMDMPPAKPVSEMIPFSVFTPYYSETVLYSSAELRVENEDGISTLFYLQTVYPDEWRNFLERIGRDDLTVDQDLQDSSSDSLELRFWASYRGQTLARTVRGMMYYRKALMLQSYLEKRSSGEIEDGYSGADFMSSHGYELSREAHAQADLKFTYVISCQIYGQQKQKKAPEAADIALLLQRNEALRVAFIHVEENVTSDGRVSEEYYSKLVKADVHGKDQEIYSIKLPGNPKLGEGKPENQNHAIIFTRGDAIQTIDMNQDNYLEEAMKVRNLLEEFNGKHGLRRPTILGVREHVFTGRFTAYICFLMLIRLFLTDQLTIFILLMHFNSVSCLAWFMSNQETSFVTLGQRVLAYPLKVRMHYGHPDVFDRIFHLSRGGISKASRVINISEDIYAGTVGKGRDVGLNQIAQFEGKVAGGNGEQVLSRDIYRLGQLFDFFRMLSFYFTSVGFYVCTMMTVLTIYFFLYGRVYLALSGLDRAISKSALGNTALDAALNAQFLVQIGVFTAVPMIMGFILELGLLKVLTRITFFSDIHKESFCLCLLLLSC